MKCSAIQLFYTYDKILLVEQLLLIYKLQETRNKFLKRNLKDKTKDKKCIYLGNKLYVLEKNKYQGKEMNAKF